MTVDRFFVSRLPGCKLTRSGWPGWYASSRGSVWWALASAASVIPGRQKAGFCPDWPRFDLNSQDRAGSGLETCFGLLKSTIESKLPRSSKPTGLCARHLDQSSIDEIIGCGEIRDRAAPRTGRKLYQPYRLQSLPGSVFREFGELPSRFIDCRLRQASLLRHVATGEHSSEMKVRFVSPNIPHKKSWGVTAGTTSFVISIILARNCVSP